MTTEEEDFDEITIEEDIFFSKLADKRLKETKYWVKHEDAWGIPGIASEYCCVVQDPRSMSFLRKQESSIKRAFNFKNLLCLYFFLDSCLRRNDIGNNDDK